MTTKGYLFEDEPEEGTPCVFFIEGLKDDDDESGLKIMEVRFASLSEAISTIATVQSELGDFEMVLGEPDHFEVTRQEEG